jgi:acetoin:2,6-dichlorophenolindophenol oxidoreductase subunit beta
MKIVTFAQAIAEAQAEEMARDPRVFIIGEDVGRQGGAFGQTEGLLERFGEERVMASPISEAAIEGIGIGAAFAGMRPIVEQEYIDFLAYMDPLVNHVAKFRYMSGGQVTLPMVTRLPNGCKGGNSATHSQSLEAFFMHIPGFLVAYPSTPYDAKGLLKTAIRDDNPVVFIEDIKGMFRQGEIPEEEYLIPFGRADIKMQGKDVTVVALGYMVSRALLAAKQLRKEDGIEVEVVDPRTLNPLDIETIVESVKKTRHLVTVHQAWQPCGVGAEIATQVMEKAFDCLEAPVQRVCGLDVPAPNYIPLENLVYPDTNDIIDAVRKVLKYRLNKK